MKKWLSLFMFLFLLIIFSVDVYAQCSICTKTAQQLGEKPAEGLNAGILYLAATPFVIAGFIAFTVWRKIRAGD
ncbi:MAG TPA: hypothetical protein VM368_09180 [Flavisolibacter sp.]|nr:hypothetical protein [Flavisolibacter sp.]